MVRGRVGGCLEGLSIRRTLGQRVEHEFICMHIPAIAEHHPPRASAAHSHPLTFQTDCVCLTSTTVQHFTSLLIECCRMHHAACKCTLHADECVMRCAFEEDHVGGIVFLQLSHTSSALCSCLPDADERIVVCSVFKMGRAYKTHLVF